MGLLPGFLSNVFQARPRSEPMGTISYRNPITPYVTNTGDESIVNAIYNQIAVDCASVDLRHVVLDELGRETACPDSDMNHLLRVSANVDQTGRAFIKDLVGQMLSMGHAVVVPVDTQVEDGRARIETLRVGRVTTWYPKHVAIDLYNDQNGNHKEIVMPKNSVAIMQNPHYGSMNAPNSTLSRLRRKLQLLDRSDEVSCSGKLDLIIQLPYMIKSDARKQQAESRRKDIEMQLSGSKYGIAYTDGTEKITQLNRAIENNLQGQVEYLTKQLYNQLGLSPCVFDGSGDERAMLNYYDRTIEPILQTIADEFTRIFLRDRNLKQPGEHRITFTKDPFKLVPVSQVAEIADKLTRNAILTPNEVRTILGFAPDNSSDANDLRNRNMPVSDALPIPKEEHAPGF